MKRTLLSILSATLFVTFFSCDKNVKDQMSAPVASADETSIMSVQEINTNIETQLNQTYSRDEVLNKLTTTASLYPKKSSNFG